MRTKIKGIAAKMLRKTRRINLVVVGMSSLLFTQDPTHFQLSIDGTGYSQLVIFTENISSLEIGDEIGVFDLFLVLPDAFY